MTGTRTPRRNGVVIAVGLGILSGLAGGPAASATWTVPLSVAGGVTAGSVSSSTTVTTLDSVITNDDYQTTHMIQVTNTQPAPSGSAATSDLTVIVNSVPNSGLGALMSVALWPVASPGDCADSSVPAPGYQSAVWTAGLTSSPVATPPGASAFFCVRGYPTGGTPSPSAPAAEQNRMYLATQLGIPVASSASGSQSFNPTYAGASRRGNFAQQSGASGQTTISTSLIFASFRFLNNGSPGLIGQPLDPTGTCWNISAGGDTSAPGSNLIAWPSTCSATTPVGRNERFIFVAVPGTPQAVQIRADSIIPANGYLQVDETGTMIQTQTGDVSELRQVWIAQFATTTNGVQFVNAATGLCIQAPATAGGTSYFMTAPCAADNRFRSRWTVAVAQ
jgi:hypothetical protein